MSSNPDVVRIYDGIRVDPGLTNRTREDCNALNLTATAAFRIFQPSKNGISIINSVQDQSKRNVHGRSIYVTLPGDKTPFITAPCIAIPIKTDPLPTRVITRDEQYVTVKWAEGEAWEIRKDIRMAPVTEGGGILLLLYLTA